MIIVINKIIDAIDLIDNETLVLCDIDNTLIQTEDLSGSEAWFYYFFNKLSNKMDKEEAIARTADTQAMLWQKSKFQTVESSTAACVAAMQAKAEQCFALTARSLIVCYNTIEVLRRNNINFESLENKDTHKLISIPIYKWTPKKYSQHALNFSSQAGYAHGIIFSGGHDQGDVLEIMKKHIHLKSKKILYINDHKKHLEEVGKYCKKHKIIFTGLLYTKGTNIQSHFHQAIENIQKLKSSILKQKDI